MRETARDGRRITVLPTTRIGWWAVGLAVANVVLVLAWTLMGPLGAFPGFLCGVLAGILAVRAVGWRGERALTVILAMLPLVMVGVFVVASLLFG